MTLLTTLVLVGSVVAAADTWTNVATGIDHLHRVANGQDYHVVRIDLTRPRIYLRATGPGQNGQRTSAWAAQVGATVAINGDLWDANNWSAYEPLGLAMGEGWKWREDTDVWSFVACDVNKRCYLNPWGNFEANNPRWHNAIGGMQDLLVIDGVGTSYGGDYYQARNPRTAIGISQDGNTMILLVVDGRRSGAAGMNFAELTATMLEFGAHNAINNDGGGSSTLVIRGAIQNVPSDGGERVVANHFGIMLGDHTDATCAGQENSRTCADATNMRTCTGGLDRGLGDCGYYGLRCEQQDLFAYCLDPRCTNGGQKAVCAGATRIGFCKDGAYSEGDCAGFGLPCVAGFGDAWCWADFYQATPVASSQGSATGGSIDVVAGQPATIWFELRNTGLKPWDSSTRLAPIPRDAASPLAAADWLNAARATAVDSGTAVGADGRFTFTIVAPHAGDFELQLGLLQEGLSWFADRPSGGGPVDGALRVTVHARPAADAGAAHDAATGPAGDDRGTNPVHDGANPGHDGASPGQDGAGLEAGTGLDAGARADAVTDAPRGDGTGPDEDGGAAGEREGFGCACAAAAAADRGPAWLLGLLAGLFACRRRCGRR